MTALVILALATLIVTACTTTPSDGPDAQGYRWEKTGVDVPLANRTVTVVPADWIEMHCGLTHGAEACAITERNDAGQYVCRIIVPKGHPDWMIPHEQRHCDGWQHPMGNLKW